MAKCIAHSNLGCGPDTYFYTLAKHEQTFATVGSDDALRLFDSSLNLLHKAQPAQSGLTCLTSNTEGFVTAGRDGYVRFWDSRAQASHTQITDPKSRGFSYIACHGNFVAAGNESMKEGLGDVSVLLYDTRNLGVPLRNYAESHTDTITQLAFHPSQPNLLLSGSTDGLVSIFDINIEDEDDSLQRVLNPRSAIHCAGFLSTTEVYIATTDEQLSIHSLADSEEAAIINVGDVRDALNCSYIVNVINDDSPAIVCGHNTNGTLSVVELDRSRTYDFGRRIDLPGAHGEEVVRDLMLIDKSHAMSCGEDGHVKLWKLS